MSDTMDDTLIEKLKGQLTGLTKPVKNTGKKQRILDGLEPELREKFAASFSLREIVQAISTDDFKLSAQALHVWATKKGIIKPKRRRRTAARSSTVTPPAAPASVVPPASPASQAKQPVRRVASDNL